MGQQKRSSQKQEDCDKCWEQIKYHFGNVESIYWFNIRVLFLPFLFE